METEPTVTRNNFDLDYQHLDNELDRVKTRVFLGSNASFLGPLMCSMNFVWSSDIATACTNGISIQWNPYWFLELPKDTRLTVLLHELWHVALLHMLRRDERNPRIWNYANDIIINNMLYEGGYSFKGTKPWIDDRYSRLIDPTIPKIGDYYDKSSEEVYEELLAKEANNWFGPLWGFEPEEGTPDEGDLVELEGSEGEIAAIEAQVVNKVVQAAQTAAMSGNADGTPSNVETLLKRFLAPKIPWETLIERWMQDLLDSDYSWKRPNRRHRDIYLPSLVDDEGRLELLNYYLDCSGSVSDKDVLRFNSEVKYLKDTYNPKQINLILFDEAILKEIVINENEAFDEVVITGRRGTLFEPIRQHIIKTKPTAAIIFSDMGVLEPMQRLPKEITTDLLWVGVNADRSHIPYQGKIIHIRD